MHFLIIPDLHACFRWEFHEGEFVTLTLFKILGKETVCLYLGHLHYKESANHTFVLLCVKKTTTSLFKAQQFIVICILWLHFSIRTICSQQNRPHQVNGHEHVSPKTVSFCTILSHSIWKDMVKNFYNIAFELHIETSNWQLKKPLL